MSVIMLQLAKGDPRRLEEYAAQNRELIQEIVAQAKAHGLIAHRFYGSEGQILIADEWPDEESFVRFAEAAGSQIEPMFQAVGASVERYTIWRKLETHDEVGWGA
jgi:quinol monooxygenase YgiN